ncbi:hypothetical protein ACVWWI_006620 [Bradyrhizobium sp. USDA 3686]|nr:hypothetical protein [Bradyrhizobium canariense]
MDLDRGVERILALSGIADDVAFKVRRGVTRPVWEANSGYSATIWIGTSSLIAVPHLHHGPI